MSNCEHTWYIDPGTDGLQQVCRSCLDFRVTPMEDRYWLKPEPVKEQRPITPVGRMRYQWQRNGEDIIGEHKSYYLVTAADVGTKLSRRADYMSERRDKFDEEFRANEKDN